MQLLLWPLQQPLLQRRLPMPQRVPCCSSTAPAAVVMVVLVLVLEGQHQEHQLQLVWWEVLMSCS